MKTPEAGDGTSLKSEMWLRGSFDLAAVGSHDLSFSATKSAPITSRCKSMKCSFRRMSVHEQVNGHEHNRGYAQNPAQKVLSHSLLLETLNERTPSPHWDNDARIARVVSGTAIQMVWSAISQSVSVRWRTLGRYASCSKVQRAHFRALVSAAFCGYTLATDPVSRASASQTGTKYKADADLQAVLNALAALHGKLATAGSAIGNGSEEKDVKVSSVVSEVEAVSGFVGGSFCDPLLNAGK